MTAMTDLDAKALEAAIIAHDNEENHQRGEPAAWTTAPVDDPSGEWSERIACMSLAIRAYLSAVPPPCNGVGVRQAKVLAVLSEWEGWAATWAGSAFVADEKLHPDVSASACKAELYSGLCGLMNNLAWLRDEVPALAPVAAEPVASLPERDNALPAEQQGLFRKFEVRRTDGSDSQGGKHHGCRYFVLDIDHDPHASAALSAYAAACESTHPQLAADLRDKWGASPVPAAVETGTAEPIGCVDRARQNYADAKTHKITDLIKFGWTPVYATPPSAKTSPEDGREAEALRNLLSNEAKNLGTLLATRDRLKGYGKPTSELDVAIEQTRTVLSSHSPNPPNAKEG